jgi:hypothetical protein
LRRVRNGMTGRTRFKGSPACLGVTGPGQWVKMLRTKLAGCRNSDDDDGRCGVSRVGRQVGRVRRRDGGRGEEGKGLKEMGEKGNK